MAKKLSRKRKAFCFEYAKDRNATQAAIRAGYSSNSAASTGHRLLKIPIIVDKIDELEGYVEMDAIEAVKRIGKMARDAKSESVRLRALERVAEIHGLMEDKVKGELIFKVLYGSDDTPEGAPPEAKRDQGSPGQAEGDMHGPPVRQDDAGGA